MYNVPIYYYFGQMHLYGDRPYNHNKRANSLKVKIGKQIATSCTKYIKQYLINTTCDRF